MSRSDRRVLAKKLSANADLVVSVLGRREPERGQVPTLTAVGTARTLSALADEALWELVRQARSEGHTWEQIGTVLGTTRQAAFQRFGAGGA